MRLLIIGDLKGQQLAATKIAVKKGAKVNTARDIHSAIKILRDGLSIDLILIDVEQDIKEFFNLLQADKIHATVIACGIEVCKEKALKAIALGAKDYLPLPPDEELIAAMLESIANYNEDNRLIYKSQKMSEVISICDQVAQSEAAVLITGKSGAGKEVIARYIHCKSKHKDRDMISLNCAAIPENLLESELFGHEKGAFTGATDRRIGKFEEANNSSIFLDEISEMDIRLQSKLLRALQEKEITRVGGNQKINLNIRVIASSNRDLLNEIQKGTFREDLYYRLNVINIEVPALNERIDDVPVLAAYFLEKYSKLNGVNNKKLSDASIAKLLDYHWPGNVRELENTIHRALLLERSDTISPESILLTKAKNLNDNANSAMQEDQDLISVGDISNAIKEFKGDELKAAMVLGISINKLRNRLKDYNMAGNI